MENNGSLPLTAKGEREEEEEGEIGAARLPDIGGYRRSVGSPRLVRFPISPAVSPHWSGRYLSLSSLLTSQ